MPLPDFTTQTAADYKANIDAFAANNQNAFKHSLVNLIHPDQSKGLQEIQKAGSLPSSFNQQWGGMGYGGLPDGTLGEIATQYSISAGQVDLARNAGDTYRSQGFKVGQTTDLASVWVKINKQGNPANDLELYIYSDTAGDPNAVISNGTATAQSGKLHTDNTDGEWVKFVFATNPNVTADTQYHIVLKSSGAVDTSNYWQWKSDATFETYPHGVGSVGDGTPTWSASSVTSLFLIEPATTILNSGLTNFDGAITSYEGATLDQSGGFYFKNADLNHKRGTLNISGIGWDKDKTFYDSGLSTDANRIVLRCNVTTGYTQVDFYENDETKSTITGTTDISTGNHTVAIRYRAEGDGSDFLTLYVDGASEGTPLTSQTFTLDRAFEEGHTSIGGGFPLAPTWTNDASDGSVLPSHANNGSFTWTGAGTEADCFVAEGDYWMQNGAGYASTQDGNYSKTTTFVNGTGTTHAWSLKIENATATTNQPVAEYYIGDGTNQVAFYHHEYFIEVRTGGVFYGFVQIDAKIKHDYLAVTKDSDFYFYVDNKLMFDGAGLFTDSTASNKVLFGDNSTAAGENADVKWYYVKYYEGVHLPEYSTQQLSELAHWNDDRSSFLSTIYNAGTILSVKTLAGINQNYVKTVKQVVSAQGITSGPTTTATSFVPADEMQAFCFGSRVKGVCINTTRSSSAGSNIYNQVFIDGVTDTARRAYAESSNTEDEHNLVSRNDKPTYDGLHFVQMMNFTASGTMTLLATYRVLDVEAE